MVKKILLNTVNKTARMDKVRHLLTSEGINIKTYNVYIGVLETEHTHVRFVINGQFMEGLHDFDIAFGFKDEDHVEFRLKTFRDNYPGSAIGYIVKTEAEETLKEEQEKLKRQQRLLLNSTYGRFGTLLPDSDYSKEFVNYGDIVAEGFTAGICKRDDSIVAKLDAVAIAKAALEKNAIGHLKTFKFKPIIQSIKPYIDKVVFNDPATIIFWTDDTKTVVKAENEAFDPEKGMAMAIAKKALGNKHDYYNTFLKYLKKYTPSDDAPIDAFAEIKVPSSDKNINKAYHVLMRALTKDKALKADYEQAAEEAVGYLGAAMED